MTTQLGRLAVHRGDLVIAEKCYGDARLARELGLPAKEMAALDGLAAVTAACERAGDGTGQSAFS
jgi:hypothetical protein